jgi:RimJ/RimL family protein N-acetyltransferase
MQIFLESDRLMLRRFTESDVDNLHDLDGDPQVMRFINRIYLRALLVGAEHYHGKAVSS